MNSTQNKGLLMQLIPVMLCFFAMGFVDLVGTASNYPTPKLTCFLLSYSSGSCFSRFLQVC